jgi:hypothetical protein
VNVYFIILEIFLLLSSVLIIIKKSDRSILYIPVFYFAIRVLGEPFTPGYILYNIVTLSILLGIVKNCSFYKENIPGVVLTIYFTLLLFFNSDINLVFSRYWTAIIIIISAPIIARIYKKSNTNQVFRDLYYVSITISFIFISNVIFSTIFNYSGERLMYGVQGTIFFGNLDTTHYNSLPLAAFVILYKYYKENKLINLIIGLLVFSFAILPMRRTVIVSLLLTISIIVFLLIMNLNRKKALYLGIFIIFSPALLISTNLHHEIVDRYQQRGLHESEFVDIEREGRFLEFFLVYNDIFIENRYSLLFGHSLFDSHGNYGGRVFSDRPLHSDITVLLHAGGIIALSLYLLYWFCIFKNSIKKIDWEWKYIIMYLFLIFLIFLFTGRFNEVSFTVFLIMLVQYPLSKNAKRFLKVHY